MSITLHPKYGVNPSVGVCFWCGKENGTVLLLGYNKDREAPRRMVSDYEPCETCKAAWAKGIVLIEVKASSAIMGRPEIAPDCVPTGRWIVVKEEWATGIDDQKLRDHVLLKRQTLVPPEIIDYLLELVGAEDSNKENES